MRTFPRKTLSLAALLLLASGLAAVANAQKTTPEIATITLSNGGKFKTAPDGTTSLTGTITNNTSQPLTVCGLSFSIDPDTISFDDVSFDDGNLNQSLQLAPGQTVALQPISVTVSSNFKGPFFLGYVGAALSPSQCFGDNSEQIPVGGDMYKIKVRG